MRVLNIGILAHVDAGKTTLTENILFCAGAISHIGRVDHGNTQTDTMDLERKRGISVKATTTSFYWNDVKINLIDTPGHVDFVAEVQRSLSILDGVVILVSIKEGLQSQTRILIDTIVSQGIPAIVFFNKIDRVGVQADKIVREVNAYMHNRLIITQHINNNLDIVPLCTNGLINKNENALCEQDHDLLGKLVNGETIAAEYIQEKIKSHTHAAQLYPAFFGSALHGVGVEQLLNGITSYLPKAVGAPQKPLSAMVFKVDNQGEVRKVYARLYHGSLKLRDPITVRNHTSKITGLAKLEQGKLLACNAVSSGDICVLFNKNLRVGDVIGAHTPDMRNICLGQPTISLEIKPVHPHQKKPLLDALMILSDEDPTLNFLAESKMTLQMYGDVQVEIVQQLLMERYNIPVEFSNERTIYMEAPTTTATFIAPIYRTTRFAAGAGFRIEPLPRGRGIEYVSEVSLGELEQMFQNAVEEAVYATCTHGIYGWGITDARVVFCHSDFDSVYGTPSAFRNLVPLVLIEAFKRSGMVLLEPYLAFDLRIPPHSVGKAFRDLSQMRAVIETTTSHDEETMIHGAIPAAECKGYGANIASYTEGQGVYLTKFLDYRETNFADDKVNHDKINPATNKSLYLLSKSKAISLKTV